MNGSEKKILLVEDEPIAQTLYQNRLEREGFAISFAEDGEVALDALSKMQPDLVVLDLMLPKVNGAEVLKHIRSDNLLKTTPVLVISNAYMTELSQKAMESGATRGMLKTECTPARLLGTVRDMLGYKSGFDLSDKPASDDKQAEVFAIAAEEALADELMLKETREEFIQKAPVEVARIRENCLAYVKAGATPASLQPLATLHQQVRFFATRAGLSGCVRIAILASAFEALLFEAVFKPAKITASIPQTIAQAVDCLERLCQDKSASANEAIPKAKILVVDDDAVCNFAMVGTFKRAHFEPVSVEDPAKALEMARSNLYDIVFLDVNMPGIDGFEVCKNLRKIPEYKETPVIFITSNGDFQNRAQSILSGGNDFIPKPVSPVELVLKTTMRLLQPQNRPGITTAALADHPLETKIEPPRAETVSQAAPPAAPVPWENPVPAPQISPEPKPPEIKSELPPKETISQDGPQPGPATPLPDSTPVQQITESNSEPKNNTATMETENKPTFDGAARGVARIIFGDENISDMNVRLTRIALERYNVPGTHSIGEIARGVAQIIFGDDNISDMNVRLTRIALERYNVADLLGAPKPA